MLNKNHKLQPYLVHAEPNNHKLHAMYVHAVYH